MKLLLAILSLLIATGCRKKEEEAPPAEPTTAQRAEGTVSDAAAAEAASEKEGAASDVVETERPLYYERELSSADLEKRSLRELSLMRNTIFARAGNSFRKKWLRTYFEAQPWYQARDSLDKSKLKGYDWANARAIAAAEASFERAELEAMKKDLASTLAGRAPSGAEEVELRILSQRLGEWTEIEGSSLATTSPLEDPRLLEKLLTVKQLSDYSRRDLRLLRNTIYARRGNVFKSELLEDYFRSIAWYKPDPDYTDDRLTAADWKNIKMIKSVEAGMGGPMTDHQHMEEEGWFAEA